MAEAELLELLLDEVEDAEEESDEAVDEDEEPEVELALAAQVAVLGRPSTPTPLQSFSVNSTAFLASSSSHSLEIQQAVSAT